MTPNYFRWVRVDESAGGGGGTWSLLTITGAATHQPSGYYGTPIVGGNNGKFLHMGYYSLYGSVNTDQYIEIWESSATDEHGIILKGDLTGSEMQSDGSGVWHHERSNFLTSESACYNVKNDMFFAIGDTRNDNLQTTSTNTGFILSRFTGSNYDGYDAINTSIDAQATTWTKARVLRTTNDEIFTFQGSSNYYTEADLYDINGNLLETLDFSNYEITGSSGTLNVESDTSNYGRIGVNGLMADKSQNYLGMVMLYHDTNAGKQNRMAVLVLASGSSGYYHSGQVTSSAWGRASTADGLGARSHTHDYHLHWICSNPRMLAFNDDYMIMGLPGADNGLQQNGTSEAINMGAIEIHKRTGADWTTSERVLSMSGSEVLAAAGLYDAHSWQSEGALVGHSVDIAPTTSDFIVTALSWNDDWGKESAGIAMIFAKDSGADTWSFQVHQSGSIKRDQRYMNRHQTMRIVDIGDTEAFMSQQIPNANRPSWTPSHSADNNNGAVTVLTSFRKS